MATISEQWQSEYSARGFYAKRLWSLQVADGAVDEADTSSALW
jgi:hypothetical protein